MKFYVRTATGFIPVPDSRDMVVAVLKADGELLEHVDERWCRDKQVVWISLVVSVVLTACAFGIICLHLIAAAEDCYPVVAWRDHSVSIHLVQRRVLQFFGLVMKCDVCAVVKRAACSCFCNCHLHSFSCRSLAGVVFQCLEVLGFKMYLARNSFFHRKNCKRSQILGSFESVL